MQEGINLHEVFLCGKRTQKKKKIKSQQGPCKIDLLKV